MVGKATLFNFVTFVHDSATYRSARLLFYMGPDSISNSFETTQRAVARLIINNCFAFEY